MTCEDHGNVIIFCKYSIMNQVWTIKSLTLRWHWSTKWQLLIILYWNSDTSIYGRPYLYCLFTKQMLGMKQWCWQKKKYPWINVLYSAAIHCSTAQHPAKDASYVNTPQSLPLSLCNAAYAERKKSDVMPACPRLSSPLTHTSTHTHTHMQTNVIYSIITSMTVQIQAHHSVLSNYWGV